MTPICDRCRLCVEVGCNEHEKFAVWLALDAERSAPVPAPADGLLGEEHCCNDPEHMSPEYRALIEAERAAETDAARVPAPAPEDHGNPDHPMKAWSEGFHAALDAVRLGDSAARDAVHWPSGEAAAPAERLDACRHGYMTGTFCSECPNDLAVPTTAPAPADGLREALERLAEAGHAIAINTPAAAFTGRWHDPTTRLHAVYLTVQERDFITEAGNVVRAALAAAHQPSEPPAEELDAAWDACVTEIREASRTLSDLYVAAPKDAQRQVAALDRIHLAIAAFAANLRERG